MLDEGRGRLEADLLLGELDAEVVDGFGDDPLDHLGRQIVEADDGVEAVAELGGEGPLDRLGEGGVGHGAVAEADHGLADVAGAGVAGHDEESDGENSGYYAIHYTFLGSPIIFFEYSSFPVLSHLIGFLFILH